MEDPENGTSFSKPVEPTTETQVTCDYCEAKVTLSPDEIAQGWYICPECGELTHLTDQEAETTGEEELEFAPRTRDVDWVLVTEVNGPTQAALLIAYLRANDVEAYAWQESAGSAFGLTYGPLAVSHIVVPEEQAELARTLLAPESVVCPNCEAELELDETEQAQGWYECPECGEISPWGGN